MEQVYWRNPKGIQYKPNAVVARKKYHFDIHRPWTAGFKQDNAPGKMHKKIFVEPIKEWSHFRGDRVEILVGEFVELNCLEWFVFDFPLFPKTSHVGKFLVIYTSIVYTILMLN